MSFFKDFKEDLSQAVNELMPEEKKSAGKTEPDHLADMGSLLSDIEESAIGEELKQVDPEMPEALMPDGMSNMEQTISSDISGDISFDADVSVNSESFDKPADPAPIKEAEPIFNLDRESVETVNINLSSNIGAEINDTLVHQNEQMSGNEKPSLGTEPVHEQNGMTVEPVSHVTQNSNIYAQALNPEPRMTYTEPVKQPEKKPVEPVFKDTPYRSAPINTTSVRTQKETGIIIDGMSVTGDIISSGNLEIFGSVKGNIKLDGKLKVSGSIEGSSDTAEVFADKAKITGDIRSTGSVKVGPGTVIKGNINATSGVIAGAVKGDIDIVGPVILDSTAIIMGNIKSKTLQINNGAVIEGLCSQCYAEVDPSSFFDN